MNAVDMLNYVEKYFDRNHNLFCMWGGLFALVFLGLFVPFNMHHRTMEKLEMQKQENVLLASQIQDMTNRMQFLELSYENKKKVLFLNTNDIVLKIGLLECDYSNYYRFLYNGNVFITTEKYFNEL